MFSTDLHSVVYTDQILKRDIAQGTTQLFIIGAGHVTAVTIIA